MISDNEIAQADNLKLWVEIFRVLLPPALLPPRRNCAIQNTGWDSSCPSRVPLQSVTFLLLRHVRHLDVVFHTSRQGVVHCWCCTFFDSACTPLIKHSPFPRERGVLFAKCLAGLASFQLPSACRDKLLTFNSSIPWCSSSRERHHLNWVRCMNKPPLGGRLA